jgi:hypothetical protein
MRGLPSTTGDPGKSCTGPAGNAGRKPLLTFALLVAVSLAVRLYPAVTAVNLTPDAVEYLDMARQDARGEFGAVTLKRHYLDAYPVTYPGNGLRPPLFPLAAGAVLAAGGSVITVQAANALAASLAVGVWFLAFAPLFSWRAAAGGALAASFSIWYWGSSVIALTEPLSMLLAGLTAWVVTTGRWRTLGGAAGLGGLCALSFLTRRMNGMLLPLVLGLFGLEAWRGTGSVTDRLRFAGRCLVLLFVWAAVLAPFAVKNVRDFGTPFYDPNTAVFRGGEETFDHYSASPPATFAEYVRHKGVRPLAASVGRAALKNLKASLAGPGGLGLLSLALPLVVFYLFRGSQPPGVWFLVSLAVLNFTAYSLVGFHGYDDPRFILFTTFPLCPLCLQALERWPWIGSPVHPFVGAFGGPSSRNTAGGSPARTRNHRRGALAPSPSVSSPCPEDAPAHRIRKGPENRRFAGEGKKPEIRSAVVGLLVAASVLQGVGVFALRIRKIPTVILDGTPVRVLPEALLRYPPLEYDRLFEEIGRRTAPGEIVATGMPWLVHFFAGRPTALLPVDLDLETLPAYLRAYRVRTVVLDPASMGRERFGEYRELLGDLARQDAGEITETPPFVLYRAR